MWLTTKNYKLKLWNYVSKKSRRKWMFSSWMCYDWYDATLVEFKRIMPSDLWRKPLPNIIQAAAFLELMIGRHFIEFSSILVLCWQAWEHWNFKPFIQTTWKGIQLDRNLICLQKHLCKLINTIHPGLISQELVTVWLWLFFWPIFKLKYQLKTSESQNESKIENSKTNSNWCASS